MARQVRIKLNRKGVGDLLRSQPIVDDVEERTVRIARAAAGGVDSEDFAARVQVGSGRALNRPIGYVTTATTEGRRAEAERRALTRAIDAGR